MTAVQPTTPARTWRVLVNQRSYNPGKVHAIDPAAADKSLCEKVLDLPSPYGLAPGEYSTDPVTCKICERAVERAQMDLLIDKYKSIVNIDLEAAKIGKAWASSLHDRGVPWRPWDPKKARPIALRKIESLSPDVRTRERLATICIDAAKQHWVRLAPRDLSGRR